MSAEVAPEVITDQGEVVGHIAEVIQLPVEYKPGWDMVTKDGELTYVTEAGKEIPVREVYWRLARDRNGVFMMGLGDRHYVPDPELSTELTGLHSYLDDYPTAADNVTHPDYYRTRPIRVWPFDAPKR